MSDDDPRQRAFQARSFPEDAGEVALAIEAPVTIYLNGREIITLLCTPEHLDELAVGFLKADGYIESRDDLRGVSIDGKSGSVFVEARPGAEDLRDLAERRMITTGCGKGSMYYSVLDSIQAGKVRIASAASFPAQAVIERMRDLSRSTSLHSRTRGVHGAALADAEGILILREDIGRHNAVDKLAGRSLMDGVDLSRLMLLATGRISSEMLIKAAKMGVAIVASRSVPTSLAVEMARQVGTTLVGGVKAGRLTVYSNDQRIIWGDR